MTNEQHAKLKQRLLRMSTKDPETKCWVWSGYTNKKGYGKIKVQYKVQYAHRVSYEIHVNPIKGIAVIHHKCSNKSCINPKHLKQVSIQENNVEMMQRMSFKKEILELKKEIELMQLKLKECQDKHEATQSL